MWVTIRTTKWKMHYGTSNSGALKAGLPMGCVRRSAQADFPVGGRGSKEDGTTSKAAEDRFLVFNGTAKHGSHTLLQ